MIIGTHNPLPLDGRSGTGPPIREGGGIEDRVTIIVILNDSQRFIWRFSFWLLFPNWALFALDSRLDFLSHLVLLMFLAPVVWSRPAAGLTSTHCQLYNLDVKNKEIPPIFPNKQKSGTLECSCFLYYVILSAISGNNFFREWDVIVGKEGKILTRCTWPFPWAPNQVVGSSPTNFWPHSQFRDGWLYTPETCSTLGGKGGLLLGFLVVLRLCYLFMSPKNSCLSLILFGKS